MFERKPKDKKTAEAHQDVHDALTLAFIDMDFVECEVEDFPLTPPEGEVWSSPKMRVKNEYDANKQCGVKISHYAYERQVKAGKFITEEIVYFQWDDDQDSELIINLNNWTYDSYATNSEGEETGKILSGEEVAPVKAQAKLALAAITTIVDFH